MEFRWDKLYLGTVVRRMRPFPRKIISIQKKKKKIEKLFLSIPKSLAVKYTFDVKGKKFALLNLYFPLIDILFSTFRALRGNFFFRPRFQLWSVLFIYFFLPRFGKKNVFHPSTFTEYRKRGFEHIIKCSSKDFIVRTEYKRF